MKMWERVYFTLNSIQESSETVLGWWGRSRVEGGEEENVEGQRRPLFLSHHRRKMSLIVDSFEESDL